MSIRLLVDSASDIIYEAAKEKGILYLPMTVTFGTEEYQDGVNLSKQEFYRLLSENEELPRTSQITPFAFTTEFKKAVNMGDTVIAITMSSGLSGTYQSACAAAEEFGDKVYVIDSLNVSIGEHILVNKALELIDKCSDAKKIVAELEILKKRIKVFCLLDTLEYLKKGGRISAAAAIAGGLLSVKPLIEVVDGVVSMIGKARGQRKGWALFNQSIEELGDIDSKYDCFIGYTGETDECFSSYIEENKEFWEKKGVVPEGSYIGGTIGTHLGPGAIAGAFVEK